MIWLIDCGNVCWQWSRPTLLDVRAWADPHCSVWTRTKLHHCLCSQVSANFCPLYSPCSSIIYLLFVLLQLQRVQNSIEQSVQGFKRSRRWDSTTPQVIFTLYWYFTDLMVFHSSKIWTVLQKVHSKSITFTVDVSSRGERAHKIQFGYSNLCLPFFALQEFYQ